MSEAFQGAVVAVVGAQFAVFGLVPEQVAGDPQDAVRHREPLFRRFLLRRPTAMAGAYSTTIAVVVCAMNQ